MGGDLAPASGEAPTHPFEKFRDNFFLLKDFEIFLPSRQYRNWIIFKIKKIFGLVYPTGSSYPINHPIVELWSVVCREMFDLGDVDEGQAVSKGCPFCRTIPHDVHSYFQEKYEILIVCSCDDSNILAFEKYRHENLITDIYLHHCTEWHSIYKGP